MTSGPRPRDEPPGQPRLVLRQAQDPAGRVGSIELLGGRNIEGLRDWLVWSALFASRGVAEGIPKALLPWLDERRQQFDPVREPVFGLGFRDR